MLGLTKEQLISWLKDSGIEIIDLITEEIAEQWCEDNGYTLIKVNSGIEEILDFETVKNISAKINKVDVEELTTKSRCKRAVYARWLTFYYYKTFSSLSLAKIGATCNRDHATVLHALKYVENPFDLKWRQRNFEEFEYKIDETHEKLDIERRFKKKVQKD